MLVKGIRNQIKAQNIIYEGINLSLKSLKREHFGNGYHRNEI